MSGNDGRDCARRRNVAGSWCVTAQCRVEPPPHRWGQSPEMWSPEMWGTVPGKGGDCPRGVPGGWGQSLGKVVPGEGDEWLKLRWLREGAGLW